VDASTYVTADFFQRNYALFFAEGAPTIRGSVTPQRSIAVGPKVQISAYFFWPDGTLRSTVVFYGAVNSSGKAVIYDCKIWPGEKW
jgi:hypothetical protein